MILPLRGAVGAMCRAGTTSFALVCALFGIFFPHVVRGGDPLMNDDKLTVSNATWHRAQLGNIDFEAACTFNVNLKNGCIRENRGDVEKEALIRFYVVMHGDNWRENTNWNISHRKECDFTNTCVDIYETPAHNSPCWDHWYGITCNEEGKVIEINLVDNRINGTFGDPDFPDDAQLLNQFTGLRRLNLATTRARYHNLPNPNANNVTGEWPSMEMCKNLTTVELSGNKVTGMPFIYKNGDTLRTLAAAQNRINLFPPFLWAFSELETLDLSKNLISESLPTDFGRNMRRARFVDISYNAIQGEISGTDMSDMSKIIVFSVAHNPDFTGVFPTSIVKDTWVEADYVSILNTTMYGEFAGLCLDVPFCWRYMYTVHADQTWVDGVDPLIQETIEKAISRGTTSTTTTTFDMFAAFPR
ncbi:unnamed protein product [Amoebophrya sp. A25]|nr:unnamed protein product [Amoebophrya sp. A25]|eukprot:GSA25T00011329001.1